MNCQVRRRHLLLRDFSFGFLGSSSVLGVLGVLGVLASFSLLGLGFSGVGSGSWLPARLFFESLRAAARSTLQLSVLDGGVLVQQLFRHCLLHGCLECANMHLVFAQRRAKVARQVEAKQSRATSRSAMNQPRRLALIGDLPPRLTCKAAKQKCQRQMT